MSPAEHIRHELAASRSTGEPFAGAWTAALGCLPLPGSGRQREDWEAALATTRSAWRRAYDGLPPSPREATLAAFVEGLRAA